MPRLIHCLLAIAGTLLLAAAAPAAVIDPTPFLKQDNFNDIKISPQGDYLAATVPLEDRTTLVIMRTSDNQVTAHIGMGPATHVAEFWWMNPERVMLSMAERFGQRDRPKLTGELAAINVDGSRAEMLVGQRAGGPTLGSKVSSKKGDKVAAFPVDDLPQDDRFAIITTQPFSDDPFRKVERLDVYTGRRHTLGRAPVRNARFFTDNAGTVRFVSGYNADRIERLYHRASDESEWVEITAQLPEIGEDTPIGFSADNRLAYLLSRQPEGTDAIVALDPESMSRRIVLRDEVSDPVRILYAHGSRVPIGATFSGARFHARFFDDEAPDARLWRSLQAAFAPQAVEISSRTADGGKALLRVWSDRSPGDYYIFDTQTKKAQHLLASYEWLDPETMGATTGISMKARDGLQLHGFLTRPAGVTEGSGPLVVFPHGGPFGIYDRWDFDPEVQLLAAAGYSVLRLNFRGSGNHGHAFQHAGVQQWGRTMQDDQTDATRWAIDQGIADPQRICIHGASYGGYAALMGAAREPQLYRCASGYVGVYDLATMHTHGDIQGYGSGETYLREWIGSPDALGEVSPAQLADRIKVPVLLAAGGQDVRAPIKHSRMMESALRKAGAPVETVYYDDEGHGFYLLEHRQAYYTKLLEFLDRHIGTAAAPTAATQ